MRLENEERFVLDNNDLVLDMDDMSENYCPSPKEICELLNKFEQENKKLRQELFRAKEDKAENEATYEKLIAKYKAELENANKGLRRKGGIN